MLVRAAAWGEQQIRAHPALHSAFFLLITRNRLVRRLAGQVKDRVRSSGSREGLGLHLLQEPDADVRRRRRQALARRLGLPDGWDQ